MKVHSIYLQEYRVLKEFYLHFEHSSEINYALDLIVGVNGTGKSSLLRAIAEIFRRLDDESTRNNFPFGFEITYQMREDTPLICITNLDITSLDEIPARTHKHRLPSGEWRIGKEEKTAIVSLDTIPLEKITSDEWSQKLDRGDLPPLIVAFTTGSEKEWELYEESFSAQQDEDTVASLPSDKASLTEWFLKEIPGEPVAESAAPTSSPGLLPLHTEQFLFIKEQYFSLIILCSLLTDTANSGLTAQKSRLQRVLRACNIKALHGFSLKFRMNKDVLDPRDFEFIRDLAKLAQNYTLQKGSDYVLVFDLETIKQGLSEFLERQGGGLQFFRTLVRLNELQGDNPPVLREVNLFFERGNNVQPDQDGREEGAKGKQDFSPSPSSSPLHLLDWFSDGERSFLGRLCLLCLLGSSKSGALILIDEPEVHFNDYWKRQLVSMIDGALQQQESHVLMTTHSSITLSDVTSRDIWILRRDGDYTSRAVRPDVKTLGADPSDIMVYIFEAENAVGAQGEAYIERKLMEIAHITGDSPGGIARKKREALESLLKQVGPGDWSFLIRRDLHDL
jgi:predicted ATPase